MYHPAPRRPLSRGPSPAPGAMPPADPYYNPTNAGYGAAMPRPRSRAASPAPPGMLAGPYGQPPAANPYGTPNAAYGAAMPRPRSRAASPAPPAVTMPGATAPVGGFQVEKRAKSPNPYGRPAMPQAGDPYRDDAVYQERVATFLLAKDEQFAVAGRIPVDPTQLAVFFRTKSGITHTLDFPIDVSYNNPPALDVLIESCRPHQIAADPYANPYGGAPVNNNSQALFFPPTNPLSATLELANYPILDAVQSALFPELAPGATLTAVRDRLDVIDEGGRLPLHSPTSLKGDGRAATLVVTLPSKFRGGVAIVRDPRLADIPASEEKFIGSGGKNGDLDWVAFRGDCDFEVETVTKGCRLSLSYAVFIKPPVHNAVVQMPGQQGAAYHANPNAEPLAIPSDRFFDLMSPIMNMSRGKSVAFFLNYDYGVNPAEIKANTIIPRLKGADALLYDAFKFYKLEPQIHWTAGGFIWDVDSTLEFFGDALEQGPPSRHATPAAGRFGNPRRTPISAPEPYGNPYGGAPAGGDIAEALRQRVEASGAISLAAAGVTLLTDVHQPTPPKIGKEKVYFVSDGELQKLVVNALLVVFIP
ncbi:hypothetical protein CVT24_011255 [Panaeolus cyanescens]|uniref:Uncharacterized protein n=1 Tax=Panaeolus cyanescens TaxID=181874 RepID=A0A409VI04_9AGAR|nr:hypothetical protein CVT24_011255 [Panaeolus cyanescens]